MKARLVMLALFPLVLFGILVAVVSYLAHIVDNPAKSLNIAVQADEMGNVAINGRFNQTLSYRAALAMLAKKRWGCWLCEALDVVVPNHCEDQLK
jgi:hypothetical protein